MNEKLIEENKKAQQDLLAGFKKEMEHIATQWQNETLVKAEKIINAALASSKEAMTRILQEATNEFNQLMRKMISDSQVKAQNFSQQAKKISRLAAWSSITILGVVMFMLYLLSVSV